MNYHHLLIHRESGFPATEIWTCGQVLKFSGLLGDSIQKCFLLISTSQIGNTEERVAVVENALIQEFNKLCLFCGLSSDNIRNGSFSCNGLTDQVVYRGRITGNDRYNSEDLVSLIQSWVASDTAVINAEPFHFNVDSTCSSSLDSLDSPDCAVIVPPSDMPSTNTAGVTAGEAVTIVVGFFIVLILVGVVILLCVLLFRKQKANGTRYTILHMLLKLAGEVQPLVEVDLHPTMYLVLLCRFQGAVRFKNEGAPKEEDTEPFANKGSV